MAFGLFKKKNYADCIFVNGNVDTKDWENPKASAIAVKNGIIMRVGENEDMEDLQGPDTVVTDLQGKYVKPGIIDLYAAPAGDVLSDIFIRLNESMTQDDIAEAVSDFAKRKPQADFIFGWGYDAALIAENESDTGLFRKRLDEIAPDKPVVLVSFDDLNMRINTVTAQIAKDRADELGIESLTPAFIMDSIVAIDYEACAGPLMADAINAAKSGITTRFNCEKSSYIDNIFRDMLINIASNNFVKQRYFGSFPIKRNLPTQSYNYTIDRQSTLCQELVPLINYNTACIYCTSNENSPYYMSAEYLKKLTEDLSDKGRDIRYIPLDRNSALTCLSVAGELSEGYKKCTYCIESPYEFSEEELSEIYSGNVIELPLKDDVNPAEAIGMAGKLGIIAEGAFADIAVFNNENDEETYMTILSGEVIYTQESTLNDWVKECYSILGNFTDDISAMKESEETEEFEESEEPEALETEESEEASEEN